MKKTLWFEIFAIVILLAGGLLFSTPGSSLPAAQANLPETPAPALLSGSLKSPLMVMASFSAAPEMGVPVDLLVEATTLIDAPGVQITVTVSAGIEVLGVETLWKGDLAAGEAYSMTIPLRVFEVGEQQVTVRAISVLPGGSTIGEEKILYLEAAPERILLSDLPPELRHAEISHRSQGVLIDDGIDPQGDLVPNEVAGTVKLRGYFGYKNQAGAVVPVRRAKVEIWDSDDPGDDDLLATVYTGDDGFYEKTVDNSDASGGVDAYARVFTKDDNSVEVRNHNDTGDIYEPGGDLYEFTTPVVSNCPDGNCYTGGYEVNDAANRQAWYIFDRVAVDAHDYLLNEVGWHNTYNLEIRWTPTVLQGSFYCMDGITVCQSHDFIQVHAQDGWDEDVFLHEYGHFVMDRQYATYPPYPNCSPHSWGVASSLGCAWGEGWATFLQGAIQGHQDYRDGALHILMEAPSPGVASDQDEASVGASLWDIFDGANETHDDLDSGMNGDDSNGLWKIIRENDPNTAGDFWNSWFESSNGHNCALHNILDHHSIATFNACAPPTPSASDGSSTSKVTISWSDYPGASEYKIYRATSSGGTKTLLSTIADPATSYDDTSPTAERIYYYFFRACNNHGCGDYSFHDTGWRAMPIPSGVSATDGTHTDKIRVTWNSVTDATSYEIYSATSPGGTQTKVGTSSTSPFDYTTATPERTYYLWVAACNTYGCSALSTSNSGYREMPTPTNISATDGTHTNKVRISWNAITGATYYKVYRGTSIGGQTFLADSSNAYYDDTSATQGRTYYYYITAYNTYGNGAQSTYNDGWRDMALPTGFAASDGTYSDKVYLNWTAVSGATYYDVYRSETQGSGGSKIASPAAPPYNDTSAITQRHYWYYLRACNTYICSSYTAENEGWRGFPGPGGVSATDGSYLDKVRITWSSVSGSDEYQVYRGTTSTNQAYLGSVYGSTTAYDDTSGLPEQVYYYDVVACSDDGCGAHSSDDTGYREMDTPTSVSASDGTYAGLIRVTFNTVSGATFFKIYRGTTPDGLSYLGDAAVSPFDDATIPTTSTYYFAVQACNGSGCGAISSSDSGYCTIGTAQGVSASDGTYTDKVRITWSSAPTAHHYDIYEIAFYEHKIGETTSTSFDYVDAYPMYVGEYYIRVCNEYYACGDPSVHNSGWRKLPTPTNMTASDDTFFGAILIDWDDFSPTLGSAEVFRKPLSGVWESLNFAYHYSIDSVTPGQWYEYRIRMCNEYGCGGYTPSDYGRMKDTTTQVTASDGESTDYVNISWNAVEGAEFYYLFFGNDPESVFMDITWTYDLSYQFPTNLFYGDPKYFSVTACVTVDPIGNWCPQPSQPDIGWQLIPAPANLQASDGSYPGGVSLTWDQILPYYIPSVHYEIFRAEAPDAPKEYLGYRSCFSTSCDPTFVDTPPPGVVYYYFVQATRGDFQSAFSSPDSGYNPHLLYLPVVTKEQNTEQSRSPDLTIFLMLGLAALLNQLGSSISPKR